MLLREVALVLRLQILAPSYWILEGATGTEQELHRLGISDASERPFCDETQSLQEAFIDESIEELEFVGALL